MQKRVGFPGLAFVIWVTWMAGEAGAQPRRLSTDAGPVEVQEVASGLDHPWGIAFLPDGRALVTERPGRLRILDGERLSAPLSGVPRVVARGQGGLLDVAIDPAFEKNQRVYLCFSEPGRGGSSTAVGRGVLKGSSLEDFTVIFSQQPKVDDSKHFGGRVVFDREGHLFITTGERFQFDPAQSLSGHLGKILRVKADGSVPEGNPFAGKADARPEIWSYGHRNVEAAAIDPATGKLWIVEMGPKGGDELNQPEAGKNHGWPLVSWGNHYDDRDIPDPPTRPDLVDAKVHWTPTISPSGMVFYTGDRFPAWKGSALIGGLTAAGVVRVSFEGGRAREAERIVLRTRIRDVEQAPDGTVVVLTDESDGDIWRLVPATGSKPRR